jgi:hypothetical protein
MSIGSDDMAKLLKAFGDADRVVISFPDGDEPSWNVKMDGSRKAANEFKHCMYEVQQAIKSAQPTSPVKPTQPVTPRATQPTQPAGNRDRAKDDGSI